MPGLKSYNFTGAGASYEKGQDERMNRRIGKKERRKESARSSNPRRENTGGGCFHFTSITKWKTGEIAAHTKTVAP